MTGSLTLERNLVDNDTFPDISGWIDWKSFLTAVDGTLKIQQNAGSTDFGAWTNLLEHVYAEVSCRYSIDVNAPAAEEMYLWVGYYSSTDMVVNQFGDVVLDPDNFISADQIQFFGTGTWQTLSGTVTPPPGTKALEYGPFWLAGSVSGDSFYLRNPFFERITPQLEARDRLLSNGDFDGDVSEWGVIRSTLVWDAGTCKVNWASGSSHFGIIKGLLGPAGEPAPAVEYKAGATYSYSFRHKGALNNPYFVYVGFLDENGEEIFAEPGDWHQKNFLGTGAWQTISDSFTAPAWVAQGGYWSVSQDDPNGAGQFFHVDDIVHSDPRPLTLATPTKQNEKKRITITDLGSLGGTFAIKFLGESTAPIAYNASAATIQAALEGLSTVNPGDVIVTDQGLSGGETVDVMVEFEGQWAGEDVLGSFTIDTGDSTNHFGSNASFESASPVFWTAYGDNLTGRRLEGTDVAPASAHNGDWMLECEYQDDLRLGSLSVSAPGAANELIRVSAYIWLGTWNGGTISLTHDGTLVGAVAGSTQAPNPGTPTTWQQFWAEFFLDDDAAGEIFIRASSPAFPGGRILYIDSVHFGSPVGLTGDFSTSTSNTQQGVGSQPRLRFN